MLSQSDTHAIQPITEAQVEAAARVIAHRMEFNSNKWPEYAEVARSALEAARDA